MTDFNLSNDCQHGFRKGRSCTTQLLQVMEDFTVYIDNGHLIDVIYFDFRKAFDQVPHRRLLYKLLSYGFTGNLLGWITDFLENRIQNVCVGNKYSTNTNVLSVALWTSTQGSLEEGTNGFTHDRNKRTKQNIRNDKQLLIIETQTTVRNIAKYA